MRRISMVGTVAEWRWFDRFRNRAVLFLPLLLLLGLLTFFPERHRAATSLTPTDPDSMGLSGTLGQLGAINNVFGNQAAVEVAMRVAKSVYVRDSVIAKVKLAEKLNEPNKLEIHRWLERHVIVRSLRGGIITIEMTNGNAELAREIVAAYAASIQERLAEISRRQTAYKRDVLVKLVGDASDRLARAQSEYDRFRLSARYADPRASIMAIGERVPMIESAIKAKAITLRSARQVFADNNIVIRQLEAELAGLNAQLAEAKATDPTKSESVGRLVTQTSQLFKLERELGISKALYDSYLRYLQGTAVEDLTSTASVRVLEAPYVDTSRQYFLPALAGFLAIALLWFAVEFYRLRPPVGSKVRAVRIDHAA